MATMKKPSAAQLRVRAEFARKAKSGAFKRKASARRKKNPVGRSGQSDRTDSFAEQPRAVRAKNPIGRSRSRTQIVPAKVPETARIWRIKNPVGRSGSSGRDISKRIVEADFDRQTRALSGRKANPIYPPVRYEVWRAGKTDAGRTRAERFIAAFASKGEAVGYAQLYADNHNKRVGIIIRGKAH